MNGWFGVLLGSPVSRRLWSLRVVYTGIGSCTIVRKKLVAYCKHNKSWVRSSLLADVISKDSEDKKHPHDDIHPRKTTHFKEAKHSKSPG